MVFQMLFSLLESWVLASCLTNFIFVWKMPTLVAPVTAKHCSYLTLLHIENQHLFLQNHAAILFQHLVMRWIHEVIFHLVYILNLIAMFIVVLCFI